MILLDICDLFLVLWCCWSLKSLKCMVELVSLTSFCFNSSITECQNMLSVSLFPTTSPHHFYHKTKSLLERMVSKVYLCLSYLLHHWTQSCQYPLLSNARWVVEQESMKSIKTRLVPTSPCSVPHFAYLSNFSISVLAHQHVIRQSTIKMRALVHLYVMCQCRKWLGLKWDIGSLS